MVAPAVEGIDLFKIAGRAIAGWIPSFKMGAASHVRQRRQSRLSPPMQPHAHRSVYHDRGKESRLSPARVHRVFLTSYQVQWWAQEAGVWGEKRACTHATNAHKRRIS
jgi:hypothetical protein